MKAVSAPETVAYFDDKWNDCSIRYGDMKKQLFEDVNAFLTPLRERIKDIRSNDEYLAKVVRQGAEQARESAGKTMIEVRKAVGIKSLI